MVGMAMAALLRSVSTKMARAPPPLLVPTSSGGSRLSTSTGGFTPSSANLRGPQNYNKEVPSGNEWGRFIAGVEDVATKTAFGLVFSGSIFIYFYVIPAMDRITTQMDTLCDKLDALNKKMKERNERGHAALDSLGSQIEARDSRNVVREFLKGERIQASGQGKEHL